jgi:hypothetical protein
MTSSSPSLLPNAVVVFRLLSTFPLVVRRPSLHDVVVCCHCLPLSFTAIVVVICHRCLLLLPSLLQLLSPLRCLCPLLPPALVIPGHSPPPDLASHCHPLLLLSATVVIGHCCLHMLLPSSNAAAIIATPLSPASLATITPSPL